MNLPPLPELPEPDTQSLAMSGRCVDYINGYEKGYEKAADLLRSYALSYGRAVQEALAARWEYRHGFDKHGVAAAIRNGVIREGEGE